MRGRIPKPTQLKVIAGNPGKRPLNEKEPKPEGDLKDCPDWFNPQQRQVWDYAIENAPAGLLKKLDRSILVVWAVAEQVHREQTELLQNENAIFVSPLGKVSVNPRVTIIDKQARLMMKACSEMGFTPASRTRISIEPNDGEQNPFLDD